MLDVNGFSPPYVKWLLMENWIVYLIKWLVYLIKWLIYLLKWLRYIYVYGLM